MADAGIPYTAVEQACVGYVYGDSTSGQRALYPIGLSGIPIYNVNNSQCAGDRAVLVICCRVSGC